jgi:hypothetical protein
MEQALALPKSKQKILLGRLWKKLEPVYQMPPSPLEIEQRAELARSGVAITHSLETAEAAMTRRKNAAMKRLQKARLAQ